MYIKIYAYSGIGIIIYAIVATIVVTVNNYDQSDILALIIAGGLALLNLFFTMVFIKKNIHKRNTAFIKGFFLSTIVRLIILVAIFFTIVLNLPLNYFVFGVSFFILYFLFQIIEIFFLHTNNAPGK